MMLLSAQGFAATDDQLQKQGLVEVRLEQDSLAAYRDRRATNGFMFGVDYEDMVLKNFVSVQDGATYKDLFGTDAIPFVHGSLDYKFNFGLGALTLGADFGGGSVSGKSDRKLSVTKYGAGIKYIADVLWAEPYVAPYIGVNAWRMSTSDKSATDTTNETTGITYNYTVGLLIQLDWIDYDAAKQATFNYGLQNTYLNVYATQYAKSGDEADVDTQTDVLWGAGLKFEF